MADVFRHIEQHRAGASGRRDRIGVANVFGDAGAYLDADHFLDRRAQHFDLPGLLGHVLPGMFPIAVTDHGDQGNARVQRFCERGQQVGRAGPQGRVTHAGPSGHPCPSICHESTAALIVDQGVLQAKFAHRIIEGE